METLRSDEILYTERPSCGQTENLTVVFPSFSLSHV